MIKPGAMATEPTVAGRAPLAGFYFLYFAASGITQPFLPAYMKSLGLSATQVGVLLAINPVASLFAPPFWAHLVDRTGRPARVLSWVSLGACVGIAAVAASSHYALLIAAFALYGVFVCSITMLADTLAMQRVAVTRESYAHMRLFGSLGYVVSAVLFGLFTRGPSRAAILVPVAISAAYGLWSLRLRASFTGAPALHPLAGLRILANRDVLRLLVAASIHWMACAPYHGSLGIHVQALGLAPSVAGLAAATGVAAELAALLAYPRWGHRVAPRHLLFVCFAVSALRWAAMALASEPWVIIALSSLHGLTFGAFYVASLALLARRVPAGLKASGQALFVAVTFGVGGIVGYAASGLGYDWLGGHRLFAVAATLEVLAAIIVLGVHPPPPPGSLAEAGT